MNEVVLINNVSRHVLAVLASAPVRDFKSTTSIAMLALLAQPVREYVVTDAVLLMNLSPVVNLHSTCRFELVGFHGFVDKGAKIVAFSVILEDEWEHHG